MLKFQHLKGDFERFIASSVAEDSVSSQFGFTADTVEHIHRTSLTCSCSAIQFSDLDPHAQYVGSLHYERQWYIHDTVLYCFLNLLDVLLINWILNIFPDQIKTMRT